MIKTQKFFSIIPPLFSSITYLGQLLTEWYGLHMRNAIFYDHARDPFSSDKKAAQLSYHYIYPLRLKQYEVKQITCQIELLD